MWQTRSQQLADSKFLRVCSAISSFGRILKTNRDWCTTWWILCVYFWSSVWVCMLYWCVCHSIPKTVEATGHHQSHKLLTSPKTPRRSMGAAKNNNNSGLHHPLVVLKCCWVEISITWFVFKTITTQMMRSNYCRDYLLLFMSVFMCECLDVRVLSELDVTEWLCVTPSLWVTVWKF